MRRIIRSEAICLRVRDYHESSKLVTFFTLDHGRVDCLAKGARRLQSKFGAALDVFAQSRIIYYSHDTRTLLTLSDAELVHSFNFSRLPTPDSLSRFLAAEQIAEFALRVIQSHDPNPRLYRLLLSYLSTLESLQYPVCSLPSSGSLNLQSAICNLQSPDPYPALVCSFLLKAASFLGFRPELRRCLICRRPLEGPHPSYFDTGRGGVICQRCAGENPSGTRLDAAGLDTLAFLLYTPVSEIASFDPRLLSPPSSLPSPLDLVLSFLGHHFDPLVLNSFRWHASLERNP
ncbi:DNA repair protein RecO [candidate division WOR-3 bacterium]|uniref:DNA repair protein RecO n=1 Tax=candidate division WOR-3 bacterium TaxID=2052148 RepID=A0A938BUF1_UNCW3|nr:DNA repair protein RecO [candidate division WOR-3 bacterium]